MAAMNAQVKTLVDNYKDAQEKAAEARKANLAARAEVRSLRGTIETLVEFGVVPEAVLGDEDEVSETSDTE